MNFLQKWEPHVWIRRAYLFNYDGNDWNSYYHYNSLPHIDILNKKFQHMKTLYDIESNTEYLTTELNLKEFFYENIEVNYETGKFLTHFGITFYLNNFGQVIFKDDQRMGIVANTLYEFLSRFYLEKKIYKLLNGQYLYQNLPAFRRWAFTLPDLEKQYILYHISDQFKDYKLQYIYQYYDQYIMLPQGIDPNSKCIIALKYNEKNMAKLSHINDKYIKIQGDTIYFNQEEYKLDEYLQSVPALMSE